MSRHSYECHSCGYDFAAEVARLEEQPCPVCLMDDVHRVWGSVGVHFRGGGWTPSDHSSGSSAPLVSGGGGPIRSDGEDRPHDVGGSDAVDVHGDSIWRPTDDAMRRTLRRLGGRADAGSVERAQDQVRKTERDANEAEAILQSVKGKKSKAAGEQLKERL